MTPHKADLSLIADQKKCATHGALCDAAVRWLYGTKRCNVALSGIASTTEVPDAIGWGTSYKCHGSAVVECKVSISDFHANKHKSHGNRMGQWRYFLVPDGLVTYEKVTEIYPRHGLLYLRRGRVSIIGEAEENEQRELLSEIRLLQFALIHVRENLLYSGCTVDMDALTKAGVTNLHRAGYPHHEFDFGIEFPSEPFTFTRGESR